MKTFAFALLGLISAVPSAADTAERLIPAGSLIQCTVSEPHLSSKSVPIGDPAVLVASSEKAMRELGWKPRYTQLDDILRTAWLWHQKRYQ